ncbi:hypothetical protein JCM15765_44550 [Paradesulfitobacterium aromaticivorans]
MDYIVGLKNDIELLSQEQAERRYLELLTMGYHEDDIVMAAPVQVQVNVDIGTVNPLYPNYGEEHTPRQPMTVNPT